MKVKAILDPQFIPMSLLCREMREATEKEGQDIVIGIERNNGYISAYRTRVYPDGVGKDELNFDFIERMVKALLWVRGGYKIIIAGSELIGNQIKAAYAKGGLRDFDNGFMSRVYERPFEVVVTTLENAPVTSESASLSAAIWTAAASALMQAAATVRSVRSSTAKRCFLRRSSGSPRRIPTPSTITRAFWRR